MPSTASRPPSRETRSLEQLRAGTTPASGFAEPLVSPAWIAEHLHDESVRVIEVDVAPTAYREGHVPGAVLWNIYADLRHRDYTPVGSAELEQLFSRSGVTPATTVVFYGYGAHLGYWLLTSRGHADARLLEGSREQWQEVGQWESDEPSPVPTAYSLGPVEERLSVSREAVLETSGQPGTIVLDVRSQAEYLGERFWPSGATEDAGRPGHVPGSVHLPIDELRTEDGRFRSLEAMRPALLERGIAPERRIVTYCTIGNRASQAWYALTHLLGYPDAAVYVGGWAEWGRMAQAPVER
jgi:thiosulfate/3-mercaptopyruvate sulfurtransferase